jgi:transcriptional regulator with XRE-family HTH domain
MGDSEPIWSLIRLTRKQRGYTQTDLAEKLARLSGNRTLTRWEVARWERGKRIPGPFWRVHLSRVLDIPRCDLERAARLGRRVRQVGELPNGTHHVEQPAPRIMC